MTSHSLEGTADGASESGRESAVSSSETDLSRWRRVAAAAVAGGLVALVLRRRSLGAVAVATVGGLLSYRLLGGAGESGRTSGPAARTGRTAGAESADDVTAAGSITVGRPAEELSEILRDAEQLDRILGPVAEVEEIEGNRHRFTVGGPLDRSLSWEMRMTDDRPGELVRWTSVGGSALVEEWTVRLGPAAGDRGTMVRLEVVADPPGGTVGRVALDRLAPVSDGLVRTALDRFKALVETGEISTIEGNPSGRGEGDLV